MQRQQRQAPLVAETAMNVLHAEVVRHAVQRHLPLVDPSPAPADSDSGRSTPTAAFASAPFAAFGAFADDDGLPLPAELKYDGTVYAGTVTPEERLHNSLETAGRSVGLRIAERLLTTQPLRGQWPAALAVKFIKTHVWPAAFGKELSQKSRHQAQESGGVLYSFDDPDFGWLKHVNVSKSARTAPRSVASLPKHSVDPSAATAPSAASPASTVEPEAPQPIPVDYIAFVTGVIYGVLETLGFGGHGTHGAARGVVVSSRLVHPAVAFSLLFTDEPSA